MADLADADLGDRGRTEDYATKLEVFRRLDEVTRLDIVLASNTSSIPIADLGAATKRPELVMGMHFFNPVPVMGPIELGTITTADETIEFGRAWGSGSARRPWSPATAPDSS